uniref:Uncharacterized protein n=1 Tax=Panagrolaimus sp. ES5 TaxID=591445 RepID=A0AC34FPB3_9BILA
MTTFTINQTYQSSVYFYTYINFATSTTIKFLPYTFAVASTTIKLYLNGYLFEIDNNTMIKTFNKNYNNQIVLDSPKTTTLNFFLETLPCKLSYYNLRKAIETTTPKSSEEFVIFITAEKIAEFERLNKILSVIAILAIISQRNHAWKQWIRNSLVCFSIEELQIRYSYAVYTKLLKTKTNQSYLYYSMSSYPLSCNIAHAKNIRQSCFPAQSKMIHAGSPVSKTAITESISTKPTTTFTTPMALLSKSPFTLMSDFISFNADELIPKAFCKAK